MQCALKIVIATKLVGKPHQACANLHKGVNEMQHPFRYRGLTVLIEKSRGHLNLSLAIEARWIVRNAHNNVLIFNSNPLTLVYHVIEDLEVKLDLYLACIFPPIKNLTPLPPLLLSTGVDSLLAIALQPIQFAWYATSALSCI